MKIAIIGAGAAGLVASIKIKQKHPDAEVFLFERLDSVGKKIKATGNGKCNIGNLDSNFDCYTNNDFVKKVIDGYDQQANLLDLGIATKVMYEDGLYPVSESASNVVKVLESKAHDLGVKIVLNTRLLDYRLENGKIILMFEKYQTTIDKLLFAVGGQSNPNLGSDGSLVNVFIHHGYHINKPRSGLCPIRVKEDVKALFGQRFHTIASLFIDSKLIEEQYGEVMFKKDGLSGIVIMNLSSLIGRSEAKDAKIYLSVLNAKQEMLSVGEISEMAKKTKNPLLAYVSEEIAGYIANLAGVRLDHELSYEECQKLAKVATVIPFTYRSHYDFEFSQVTIGGVSIDSLNEDLSSKLEKNVYFLGEVVDVDGPCGGYNLRWAIGSAVRAADSIN